VEEKKKEELRKGKRIASRQKGGRKEIGIAGLWKDLCYKKGKTKSLFFRRKKEA